MTSSSQKINSSPKQLNLEKLEAIRERYGIQLPSKYEKDIVEKALEKREEYRKKLPAMIWIYQVSILHILSVYFLLITFISFIFYTEDNYQNLAKELSELRMKYNQLERQNEKISKHAKKSIS